MSLYNLLDKLIDRTKQSDYFINDPKNPSFIKNRPFESWAIPKNTILWGGKQIMYSVDKELPKDRPLGLVPGAKYKVSVGEPDVTPTSYECEAVEHIASTGQRYVVLGNIELFSSTNVTTGLPFIIYETFYEHTYVGTSYSGPPEYYNHCNLFKNLATKERYSGLVYIELKSMEEVEWVRPLHTKYYTPGSNTENSGGASDCDWNIMKNRPFGTEVKELSTIEWNGDSTGKETLAIDDMTTLVKINDEPIQLEDLIGATVQTKERTDTGLGNQTITVTEDFITDGRENGMDALVLIANGGTVGIVAFSNTVVNGKSYTKGIWVADIYYNLYGSNVKYYVSKIECVNPSIPRIEIKTIEPKYLPNDLGEGCVFYIEGTLTDLTTPPSFTTPFEDVVEAYNNGKVLMSRMNFMGSIAHGSLINKTDYGFSFGLMAVVDLGAGITPVMGVIAYNKDTSYNQLQMFPLTTTGA